MSESKTGDSLRESVEEGLGEMSLEEAKSAESKTSGDAPVASGGGDAGDAEVSMPKVKSTPSTMGDIPFADGYNQTYIVLKPSAAQEGSSRREAFFRFGNWTYTGEVDLRCTKLSLADIPFVLPALQKQQSMLKYLCEFKQLPESNQFRGPVDALHAAAHFIEKEITGCGSWWWWGGRARARPLARLMPDSPMQPQKRS